MDLGKDDREMYLFSFAFFSTLSITAIVFYTMCALEQLQQGAVSARSCCKNLNDLVPIKTFLHLILTIAFLVQGHIYLFLMNLPMVIWFWKNLTVGYDPVKLANPRLLGAYLKETSLHMCIFLAWLTIYAYYVTVLAGVKIEEIKKRVEEVPVEPEPLVFEAFGRQQII